jgi:hypothetical protein
MIFFVVLALDFLWHLPERWLPIAWQDKWRAMTALLPVIVLVLTLRRDLPFHAFSAISEPVYQAGLWTKANLPNARVNYLVDSSVTAYWLHVEVLGNPRVSTNSAANYAKFDARRNSSARWTDPGGLPFAIVQDIHAVPRDILSEFNVLYESSPAAVVQRSDVSMCRDNTPPINHVNVMPRGWTIAQALAPWLSISQLSDASR